MTYDKTIRDAYTILTKAGFEVTPPRETKELVPMVKHEAFSVPQHHRVILEIGDANHFMRTVHFARHNHLFDQFARKFTDLMGILVQTSGPAIPRKSWEREDAPQQYEPGKPTLYPDGYTDPGFGWSGAGMVGGLIFHSSAREWSTHT